MSKLSHSNDETMREIELRSREQDEKRFASARVIGVRRDTSDSNILVMIFNQVPSDADLRRIHQLLAEPTPQRPLSSDGGESPAQSVACPTDKEK